MTDQNPGATVHDLIRQREQLTGWIARLDQVGPQASTRAAERIRADYADRLRRVNDELSAHRGEIQADLERFRAALAEADERRLAAADEMDEASLRHLIGELDEGAWNEARPGLESRVRAAEETVAQARGEVERLEALAADIASIESAAAAAPARAEEPAAPPAPAENAPTPFDAAAIEEFEPDLPDEAPAAPVAEEAPPADAREAAESASADEWDPFGGEFGAEAKQGDAEEDLPWLEGIDQTAPSGWTPPAAEDEGLDFLRDIEASTAPPTGKPTAGGDLGADDLAFLEELDRAIGGGSSAGAAGGGGASATPTPPPPPAQPAAAGAKAEPLLCKECGAINEPHSWYCEICGSEL